MDNKIETTWERIKDSDIYFSFIKSPTAIISSIILFIIFFCSFFEICILGVSVFWGAEQNENF